MTITPESLLAEAVAAADAAEAELPVAAYPMILGRRAGIAYLRGAIADAMVRTDCASRFGAWVDAALAQRAAAIAANSGPQDEVWKKARAALAARDWVGAFTLLDSVDTTYGTESEALSILLAAGDLEGAVAMLNDAQWPDPGAWATAVQAIAVHQFQVGHRSEAAATLARAAEADPRHALACKASVHARWAVHCAKAGDKTEAARLIRTVVALKDPVETPEAQHSILFALTGAINDVGDLLGNEAGAILVEAVPLLRPMVSPGPDGLKRLRDLVELIAPAWRSPVPGFAQFLRDVAAMVVQSIEGSPLDAADRLLCAAEMQVKAGGRDATIATLRSIERIALPIDRMRTIETVTFEPNGKKERSYRVEEAPDAQRSRALLGRAAGLWSALGADAEAEELIARTGTHAGRFAMREAQVVAQAEHGAFDAAFRTFALLRPLVAYAPDPSFPADKQQTGQQRLIFAARRIASLAARRGDPAALQAAMQHLQDLDPRPDPLDAELYIPPLAAAGAVEAAARMARGLPQAERQSMMLVQVALIIGVPRKDWRHPMMLMV